MSMTRNEAEIRAAEIWPENKIRVQPAHRLGDGCWYVYLTDLPSTPVHMLDGNGHPVCRHAECVRI